MTIVKQGKYFKSVKRKIPQKLTEVIQKTPQSLYKVITNNMYFTTGINEIFYLLIISYDSRLRP